MRVAAALGGNALLRRGEPLDADTQRRNVRRAAEALAPIAREHELVVTHGNGPQVGLLALQAEARLPAADGGAAEPGSGRFPLDVLGAESEGMIGYVIETELRRQLPHRSLATLLTQVEVDADDPAFGSPAKPIGPVYDDRRARELERRHGWAFATEPGGRRRVVASPEPRRILELGVVRLLVEAGVIVICAGGGGIPVARSADGSIDGVEAVVDKDLTAALLARELGAEALLLLTDVDAVYEDWPEPALRPLSRARPDELRALSLAAGSMAPKAEAACRFAEATGGSAHIGRLEDAQALLAGTTGTAVRAEAPGTGRAPEGSA